MNKLAFQMYQIKNAAVIPHKDKDWNRDDQKIREPKTAL